MRFLLYLIVLLTVVGIVFYAIPENHQYPSDDAILAQGKDLFAKHCMSCHGLQNDGFGPPLGGITSLISQSALLDFIKDPSKLIESGDPRAVSLLQKYKRIMPPFEWMQESQIISILAFIQQQSDLHHITPMAIEDSSGAAGITGRLVEPVQKSAVTISLEEVVQLPPLGNSSDLGVVTLRAHPAGDGSLFAGDQHGVIYRIDDGQVTIFLDLREQLENFQSGPGIATGLGSFDFHPDFLKNGLFYISHAETYLDQTADYLISDSIQSEVQWVIAEWRIDDVQDTVFSGMHRELLRLHAPTFAHGCQEIAFIPGLQKDDPNYSLLYIGYGDGGAVNIKHPEMAHHLKSFLGTIMRIDPGGNNSRNGNYGIPASNPFVNEPDGEIVKEIYAYGFRNPHRMSWDSANGNRMMVTDVGESNIEELNLVISGGDYGWPNREGNYGIAILNDPRTVFKLTKSDLDLYEKPLVQYDHEEGNAISGGYVYSGILDPLKNKYVFGDIVTGKLYYVNIDEQLSDSTIFELGITHAGSKTNFQQLCQTNRLHLRVAYDQIQKQMYLITKVDGKIWRIAEAG